MKAQRAKLKPSTRTERIPDQGYKASHDPSAATGDDDREYVAQNPVTVSLESVRKGCKRTRRFGEVGNIQAATSPSSRFESLAGLGTINALGKSYRYCQSGSQ